MFNFLRKQKDQPVRAETVARRALPRGAVAANAKATGAGVTRTASNVVAMPARAPTNGGTDGAAKAPAPTVVVIAQSTDLPAHSSVFSGQDKFGLIRLDPEQVGMLCVIRCNQHEARVVWGPRYAGLAKAQRIGIQTDIKGQLNRHGLSLGKNVHVTEEVLKGLLNGAKDRVSTDADVDAAKSTDSYQLFQTWGGYCVENDATDVHIEVRGQVVHQRFRIDTELELMRDPPLVFPEGAKNAIAVAYNKTAKGGTISHSNFMESAFQYAMFPFEHKTKPYKFRLQTIPTDDGFDIIMRKLEVGRLAAFPLFAETGKRSQGFELSQQEMMLRAMDSEMGGLIVVTGVTGSGKTTAVKAMLDFQPGGAGKKRIGVEDPKEYDIDNYTSITIQRDVGDPEGSKRAYSLAYASLMRADLDVGMVGEIRDNVSVNAAMVIAESGHLAIGSNHARSMMGIIPRMTSQQIGGDLHAMTEPDIWRLMVYQSLVPTLCPHCRIAIADAPVGMQEEMRWVAEHYEVDTSGVFLRNHDGCEKCRRGVKGMTVIAEVYEPSNEFLDLMRERRTREARELWLANWDGKFDSTNMVGKTVYEHAFLKMLRGAVDPSVARNRATGQNFRDHLRNVRGKL